MTHLRAPKFVHDLRHTLQSATLRTLILALPACQLDPASRTRTTSMRQPDNVISDVSIKTSAAKVDIDATTTGGRRLQASGPTTKAAVDNLERAAN